jgi:hypothetical protein
MTRDPIPILFLCFFSRIPLSDYSPKNAKVLSPVIKQLDSEAHIMNVCSSTSILVYICMA